MNPDKLSTHLSHYFEREYGPLLNICDLSPEETRMIIERESDADTGFNRFSYGQEFFEYRKLADDLLMNLYADKFGKPALRRPFYAVLGDADVVGGLYRDPWKMVIPIEDVEDYEVTFMCPDHFHLVGLSGIEVENHFGSQAPKGWSEAEFPYFGKLLTYSELQDRFQELKIDRYLKEQVRTNSWYRYVEAHIWADPGVLRSRFSDWIEVDPEPWSSDTITYLQNYKQLRSKE